MAKTRFLWSRRLIIEDYEQDLSEGNAHAAARCFAAARHLTEVPGSLACLLLRPVLKLRLAG